jgi:porin
MKPVRLAHRAGWLAGLLLCAGAAVAQTPPAQTPPAGQGAAPAARESPTPTAPSASSAPAPTGLWERSNLLGDAGGLRPFLDAHGIEFGLTETDEVLGNPTGGIRKGAIYEGALEMSLGVDLGKAVGLQGGIFNVSAWQIRGHGLSLNNIDNLQTVSTIEALPSARLFELWYQQSFLGGKFDIRVGQLAADQEFIISQYAGLFINSGFGWPTLPAVDLPAGGPAYPLSTPGVRLRVAPTETTTALLGVFNGNPAPGMGNPQLINRSGTNFPLNGGVFVIGEVQKTINQGEDAKGLPGTYKLGAWYNSNAFPNQALSAPAISVPGGPPSSFRRDWSVYVVADQLVFRPAGAKNGGLGVFVRAMGAPGDRNLAEVFADGGLTYKGLFGRDNDTAGIGVGWLKISGVASAADKAAGVPPRTAETVVELTYQAQLAPWWIVQPDFQYVFNPSGGVLNPNGSGQKVGSAAVLGLRTTVTF